MGRSGRWLIGLPVAMALVACPAGEPPNGTVGSSSASSSAGTGGMGGAVSVVSSSAGGPGGMSSSSGASGSGGEGGKLPPRPIDCSKLNPGITCVEDRHCPYMTKEVLDACGPWSCAWLVEPNIDAGIPGKRGCKLLKP